jgi:peroxiredoxin
MSSLRTWTVRGLGLAGAVALVASTTTFLVADPLAALPPPDATLPVDTPVPRLTLTDSTGAPVPLVDAGGAPTLLLVFRAARCPWCRAQLKDAVREARAFATDGVRVLGVCADDRAALERERTELGVPFPLLVDEGERATTELCGGRAHCIVLIDGAGTIRWSAVSESWSELPPLPRVRQAAASLRR